MNIRFPFFRRDNRHTGTVRGWRLETVWDTVPGDGHRPAVPSDDHYEGSTRQRPVTNYILLAQSRSARTYTVRERASLYVHTYTVTSPAVRWRKSKSLGRLKASHGNLLDWSSSHVSLKSLYGANRRPSPPILSLLFLCPPSSFRTRRGYAEYTREGPPTFLRVLLHVTEARKPKNTESAVVIHTKHFLTHVDQN